MDDSAIAWPIGPWQQVLQPSEHECACSCTDFACTVSSGVHHGGSAAVHCHARKCVGSFASKKTFPVLIAHAKCQVVAVDVGLVEGCSQCAAQALSTAGHAPVGTARLFATAPAHDVQSWHVGRSQFE
ncbi:hypothetical protein ASF16_19575 [Acidovorax sp. Leaf78]|nr:hypothetical protein ASF16_19575 [Acidovorax sp. Leaf78]